MQEEIIYAPTPRIEDVGIRRREEAIFSSNNQLPA